MLNTNIAPNLDLLAPKMKPCSRCHTEKPLTAFYANKNQCKACRAEIMAAARDRSGQRKCSRCKRYSPDTQFHGTVCNGCTVRARKHQRRALAKKEKKLDKYEAKVDRYTSVNKVCRVCKQTKLRTDFHKDDYRVDGTCPVCKECVKTTRAAKLRATKDATSPRFNYNVYDYGGDFILATTMKDHERVRRYLDKNPQGINEVSVYMQPPNGWPLIRRHAANTDDLRKAIEECFQYLTELIGKLDG